ncbi:MAG: hypothetical protein JXM79_11640 [Sedimentisphaerales bacterium]|nr:hypothetical protein [Sedimentisphaerales bacterium]
MVNPDEGKEITRVEISTDETTWDHAEILNEFKPDVWKHWRYEWEIEKPGFYNVYARVTDAEGNIQNETGSNGRWGYQVIVNGVQETDCTHQQRADLDEDGFVDFSDFSLLADQWLLTGDNLTADVVPLDGDGQVNRRDLMLIADEWLRCFVPAASDPSPAAGEQNIALPPPCLHGRRTRTPSIAMCISAQTWPPSPRPHTIHPNFLAPPQKTALNWSKH